VKTLAISTLLLLQACASVKNADVRDPWESMNRSVYNFNEALDNAAIKPAAKVYTALLPSPVRTGIHNFFGNLGDVWTLANTAMQLKGQATAETFMRIKRGLWANPWLLGRQTRALCGAAHFGAFHHARQLGHAHRYASQCGAAIQ
jgi:ABC-type transporter lipoprotein component MlaA